MIKRIGVGLVLLFYIANALLGQNELDISIKKSVNQSTLFGIGSMSMTDTYLSPLEYNGISLSLMHERLNSSSWINGQLLFQQQYFLQAASTKNPIGNSKSYYGNIDYKINGLYPFIKTNSFRMLAGAGADLSLGGIYNLRNSNNPAQLKTSLNFTASALAFYQWNLLTLRWQVTSPFLGVFFSPEYGQSYYEIFVLGNNEGTIHLGSPANQIGLRNYFTADYPIGNITLRGGYLGNYYRTNVNNLITSLSSHQFMIGIVFESLNFGRRDVERSDWLKSVYYE